MATESPIRMLETSGQWPSHKEAATFAPSSANMTTEEMGLLQNGHKFHGKRRDTGPNRSGSAPPSMEGSLMAIENLIYQHRSSPHASLASVNSDIKYVDSKEQLCADPAYLARYSSVVNSNPRLTPSLTSRENWRARHVGGFGNSWRLSSFDDSSNSSLNLSRGTLSTHKEESEDDRSPKRNSSDSLDKNYGFWSAQDLASLAGQYRSSVDSMREDLPRSPSPIYDHSLTLGHRSSEEGADPDACSISMMNPATSTEDDTGISSHADPSSAHVSSLFASKPSGNATPMLSLRKDKVAGSDVAAIESEMKALNISTLPTLENQTYKEEWRHSHHNNLLHQQFNQQQSNTFEFQSVQSQVISQGMNHMYVGTDQFPHGPTKFPAEVQPVLQSSGFTPPLYASAAAYMTPTNPFYPNMQPSGFYPHQYGVGGYALNSAVVPPFVPAYSPHGSIPFTYDGATAPVFNAQISGVSSGGSIHGADGQQLDKSYGHPGFAPQPSFFDPLHMQYLQQPFWDAYAVSSHLDPLALRGGVIHSQMNVPDKQKATDGAAFSDEKKLLNQRSGVLGTLNRRRGGAMSPNCFGSPTNMGIMMQYPTSPLASPVLPGSPMGGTSLPRGKSEIRFTPGSGRNAGPYSGWPGQRGVESLVDPKAYSFLEELKSGKGRRFELSDIAGHIVEFSADQHGSRFIQQKLEACSVEEKASVFKEVLPQASKLMTDVFGNYVIQKFFEYGSPDQRKELADQLAGQILPLSLQMYGCRVIQKALEVIDLDQKTMLVRELDGHILRCVRDQNGNHVIQKCIESIATENIGFIISAFRGHVAILSAHPYGCRVIQRILEHCTDDLQSQFIVDEILESVCALAQDQYGNYVTQHVLERGKPRERSQIVSKLSGHVVQLSQHKFASNVVEKCLEYGDAAERELLIQEIVGHSEGNDNLLMMMKDQYANYVVQKVLETCTDSQREILLSRVKVHINALKKYTYGKHIVARFEQLFGEEIHTLPSG